MLFFSPIISLFSIIFMIFSLSPIAYFPFLSWDCCHVEQAAAAAVGSSVGGDTDTSFRSRGSIESDLITWLVLSTCFSYASCSKLYFWADEDRFRVVSNGWNPKIPSTSPNVHRDFPKLGCSSMFYFTNCCPHEPGSPKPKPKKPAAKAGQTCQFGNPADG